MIPGEMPNHMAGGTIALLEDYMCSSSAFRNKRLSISELAVALRIHPKTLSGIINNHYQKNFNDWINTYRVNYVISILKTDDWQKHSLEGIADGAGFASRSAFFAAFKHLTGRSPLDFMRNEALRNQ